MFQRLATALLLRRMVKDLHILALAADRQTALLARLADRFAPEPVAQSAGERATIKADTGVSYADLEEVGLAIAFSERLAAHTGHTPDDDELLIYLGDEKTRDLAERLRARDEELTRLQESRR